MLSCTNIIARNVFKNSNKNTQKEQRNAVNDDGDIHGVQLLVDLVNFFIVREQLANYGSISQCEKLCILQPKSKFSHKKILKKNIRMWTLSTYSVFGSRKKSQSSISSKLEHTELSKKSEYREIEAIQLTLGNMTYEQPKTQNKNK